MSTHTKTENRTVTVSKRIDEIASGAMELFQQAGSFEAELAVARAMSDLRAILTPEVMQPVMALMNTDLGFRTDRDPKVTPRDKEGHPMTPYSVDVVRECFIESKLRGFHSVGNEWNIIATRFYACKNGLRRKVITYRGVTDFKDTYEVPRMVQDKGAIVKCRATWKKDGVENSLEREFPIRVNAYMGSDAILGKAQRKLLAAVHDRLAGVVTPEGDVNDEIIPTPTLPLPSFSRPVEVEVVKNQTPTDQQQLAEIVTKAGYTFDDFMAWGLESGNLTAEQADAYNHFDDLPETWAKRFVTAQAGLLRGLATLKGKK
ncbi:MAG TPA: hypothetical protein VHG89_04695 [Verrucomicrobiae bacterium]|nr:hypothetical protein [Verrucomicrobiae bacterium]